MVKTLSGATNLTVADTLKLKKVSANGSLGTAGEVLHSNGTATYWAADDQGVTSVATGNGMTGGTITTTGTVSVLANAGIIANATGTYVDQTYAYSWTNTHTWNKHLAIGNNATLDYINTTSAGAGVAAKVVVGVQESVSGSLSGGYYGISSRNEYTHSGASSASVFDFSPYAIVSNTSTGPFGFLIGQYSRAANYGSGDVSTIAADYNFSLNYGSGNVATMFGNYGVARHYGSGIVTTFIGQGASPAQIHSTGNVTTSTGLRIYSATANNTGRITGTNYGIYISTQNTTAVNTGALHYNMYSEGSTTFNIFEGSIGIANAAPTHKLRVDGTTSLAGAVSDITTLAAGNTTVTGFVNATSSVNSALLTVGTAFTANSTVVNAASLVVSTNTATIGTAAYHVANGNFGIGTSSPTSLLHVASAAFPVARIERSTTFTSGTRSSFASVHKTTGDMTDTFGTDVSFIIRDSANVDNEIALFGAYRDGADNSGTLIFYTYNAGVGSTKMYIKPNGSVGIGNAVPTHLLRVDGTTSLAGAVSDITTLAAGNTSITGFANVSTSVNSALLTVGTTFIANATQLTTTVPFSANGGVGSAGQILTSNGATGSPFWATPSVNTAATYTWTNAHVFQNTVAITGGLTVNSSLTANGSLGSAGQVLVTSGAGNVYWASVSGLSGGVNTAAQFTWTNSHVFQNTVAITGGLIVNSSFTANGSLGSAGQVLVTAGSGNVYWAAVSALSGGVNTFSTYTWSNTHTFQNTITFSSLVNAAAINVTGQVNTATLYATTSANIASAVQANATGVWTTGTVNALSHTVGTAFTANSTGAYHIGTMNAASYTVGTSFTANSTVVNAASYYAGTLLVANSTVSNATHLGGQLPAYYTNATNITTGTLPYAQIPANVINTTAAFTRTGITTFSANIVLGSSALSANGGFGSAGEVLHSNGTATYWSTDGDINTTYDLLTVANTVANEARVRLKDVTNSNDDILIVGANGITTFSNSTAGYAYAVGSSTVTVNATGIHVNPVLTITDLTVSGNLSVLGDTVTLNVASIAIEDSLVEFARNQDDTATFTDALDIGIYGSYGNTSNSWSTGLFRDQSDSGTWKIFQSNGIVTNTNINTTNASLYGLAPLRASSFGTTETGYGSAVGGAISNATVVAVGNSTANVIAGYGTFNLNNNLVANSTGVYHTGTMNAASYTVGTSFTANSTLVNAASLVVSTNTATIGTAAYFVSNGSVGIGTATPSEKLHVYGSTNIYLKAQTTTTATSGLWLENSTGWYKWQMDSTRALSLTDSAGPNRIFVANNGNIGLGDFAVSTPSTAYAPKAKLDVTGSLSVGYALTDTFSVPGNSLVVSGNVGIGNTAPAFKLRVEGTTSLAGAVSDITTLAAGNTTVTGFANVSTSVNSALLTVGTSFIANTTGAYHTGTVNAASHTVGTSFTANSTAIVGTGYANVTTSVNSALLTVGTNFIANTTAIVGTGYANVTTSVNSALLTVGTNFIANSTAIVGTGYANVTTSVNSALLTVGTNFIANTTAIVGTGYANVTTSVNSALLTVGTAFIANTTGAYHTGTVNAASHTVGTAFTANSTVVNAVSLVVSTNTATIGTASYFVSNGNVGIGTSTPGVKLDINGNARIANGSSLYWYNYNSTTNGPSITGTNDSLNIESGPVGSARGALTLTGHNNTTLQTDAGYLTLSASVAGSAEARIMFNTASSERMRITNTGFVGIGTSSPNTVFHVVSGSNVLKFPQTDGGDVGLQLEGAGAGHSPSVHLKNAAGYYRLAVHSADGSFRAYNGTDRLTILQSGNVGIGTATPSYTLQVNGSFAATTKSFVIDHPTKTDMKLRYGSLEGPENGVYVRGRANTNKIELPDYWTGLINQDSITVNLTPIGKKQDLYVKDVSSSSIVVGGSKSLDFYYTVFAERKDVEKLVVEF